MTRYVQESDSSDMLVDQFWDGEWPYDNIDLEYNKKCFGDGKEIYFGDDGPSAAGKHKFNIASKSSKI